MLVVLVASASVSVASSSLLSDLDGTVWTTTFGDLAFDVNSSVCGTAGAWYAKGLLEDLVEESANVLSGIWTEELIGKCTERRPSGRNEYGRLLFNFDEEVVSFAGTWAFCDDDVSDSLQWEGIRVNKPHKPLTEANCPELYGGPTPAPAAAPSATPTPLPLDFSRRPPGPPITVDLVGERKPDGTHALASGINVGPVSNFGGRLVESESGDAIIYALLQLAVVIVVGEITAEIAKVAAERSVSLSSWNRLRTLEATLSPITSLIGTLFATRATGKRKFRLPSRSTLWGIVLGVLVIVVDLGLLLGSQYTSREYTKDEVFAPVVVLGTDATRRIAGVPTIVEVPLRSESPGFTFNRHLWLSVRTPRNDFDEISSALVALFVTKGSPTLTLLVSQNESSWLYHVSLSWKSTRTEGELEPVFSFGSNPERILASWLQNFAREIDGHTVVHRSAKVHADGTFSALVVLNGSIADPSELRHFAGEHLIGSLSLTTEVREDVPYGAILWSGQSGSPHLQQRDFVVGVGQKPRMGTKVLCIAAGLSVVFALIVISLLCTREGHDVSPLIKRYFGLRDDARLWKVFPEPESKMQPGSDNAARVEESGERLP